MYYRVWDGMTSSPAAYLAVSAARLMTRLLWCHHYSSFLWCWDLVYFDRRVLVYCGNYTITGNVWHSFSSMTLSSAAPPCLVAYVANGESCTFPPTWRDSWVMNGFGRNFKVSITRSSFSNKGTCINSTTDNKYLLRHQRLVLFLSQASVPPTCCYTTCDHVWTPG